MSYSVSRASRATGVNLEGYLVWGGIALVGYFVAWPMLKGLFAIKQGVDAAMDAATDALSSGLYRAFGPALDWDPVSYTAVFPDGSIHAIPSQRVDSGGIFNNTDLSPNYKGDGKNYRLLVNTTVRSGINKRAVLA